MNTIPEGMIPQKCQQQQKGGSPPKPVAPPPPVRESNNQTAAAGESERRRAANRTGYQSSLNPKSPQSLLGGYDVPSSRTLL